MDANGVQLRRQLRQQQHASVRVRPTAQRAQVLHASVRVRTPSHRPRLVRMGAIELPDVAAAPHRDHDDGRLQRAVSADQSAAPSGLQHTQSAVSLHRNAPAFAAAGLKGAASGDLVPRLRHVHVPSEAPAERHAAEVQRQPLPPVLRKSRRNVLISRSLEAIDRMGENGMPDDGAAWQSGAAAATAGSGAPQLVGPSRQHRQQPAKAARPKSDLDPPAPLPDSDEADSEFSQAVSVVDGLISKARAVPSARSNGAVAMVQQQQASKLRMPSLSSSSNAHIQRFIRLFSSNDSKASTSSSPAELLGGPRCSSRRRHQDAAATASFPVGEAAPPDHVPHARLLHQGELLRRAAADQPWRPLYALLAPGVLHTRPRKPAALVGPDGAMAFDLASSWGGGSGCASSISLQSAAQVLVLDTREHVFSVDASCSFKASSADDMLRWVEQLQAAAMPSADKDLSAGGARTEITPNSKRRFKRSAGKTKSDNAFASTSGGGGSGAYGSASYYAGGTTASSAALGTKLQHCATASDDDMVPLLVQLCVKVVEAHGLDVVGVYRVPGNTAAVNALTSALDQGFEHVDFADPRWKDVNVVSSLLKKFFHKLPEPLLTDKLYPIFIDANRISMHEKRLRKIRHLIRKLPKQNHDTLKYLLNHLYRVCGRSHVNKMEARNLAVIFGPSLVRSSGDSTHTMVAHMSDQCKLVETMIVYYEWLFHSLEDDPVPATVESTSAAGGDEPLLNSFSDHGLEMLQKVQDSQNAAAELAAEMAAQSRLSRLPFGTRRNSKKAHAAVTLDTRTLSVRPHKADSCDKTDASHKTSVASASARLPQAVPTADCPINGRFQERNIDEEIAVRAPCISAPMPAAAEVPVSAPAIGTPPEVNFNEVRHTLSYQPSASAEQNVGAEPSLAAPPAALPDAAALPSNLTAESVPDGCSPVWTAAGASAPASHWDGARSPATPSPVTPATPATPDRPTSARTAAQPATLTSPRRSDSRAKLEAVYAEMRRQRERNIYTARRIFIAGSQAAADACSARAADDLKKSVVVSSEDVASGRGGAAPAAAVSGSDPNLDRLVRHTRHLESLDGGALEVLSPETREKIRRLQMEGQLQQLRLRELRQNAQLKKLRNAKLKVERDFERARLDAERDDALDELADSAGSASLAPGAPQLALAAGSSDVLSTVSDEYSARLAVLCPPGAKTPSPTAHSLMPPLMLSSSCSGPPSASGLGSSPGGRSASTSPSNVCTLQQTPAAAAGRNGRGHAAGGKAPADRAWYETPDELYSTTSDSRLSSSGNTLDSTGDGDSGTGTSSEKEHQHQVPARFSAAVATIEEETASGGACSSDNATPCGEPGSAASSSAPVAAAGPLQATERAGGRISQKIRFRRDNDAQGPPPAAGPHAGAQGDRSEPSTHTAFGTLRDKVAAAVGGRRTRRADPRRHTLTDVDHLKHMLADESTTTGECAGGAAGSSSSRSGQRLYVQRAAAGGGSHSNVSQGGSSTSGAASSAAASASHGAGSRVGRLKNWFRTKVGRSTPDLRHTAPPPTSGSLHDATADHAL